MEKSKKRKIIVGVILVLVLLSIGFFITIALQVMSPMVNMHIDFSEVWTAKEFGLEAKHFFVKTDDGLKISAYEVAVEKPKAIIVCLSGIHNPSATIYFGHARFFKEHGYATILFDMRAHGESDGDVICLGYKEYLDTKAIVQYIKAEPAYKNVPVVVFGLSMGGVTAINSIGEIPEINGLISLSAYSSWEDIFYDNMTKQAPVLLAKIVKPFVSLTNMFKYKVNIWSVNPKKEIEKLGDRPALLMHTKGDSQVSFSNFEKILSHSPSHVETFVREGDIHFITESFTEPEKDTLYATKVLQFLDKNFPGR
jgi:uncharacterized protein